MVFISVLILVLSETCWSQRYQYVDFETGIKFKVPIQFDLAREKLAIDRPFLFFFPEKDRSVNVNIVLGSQEKAITSIYENRKMYISELKTYLQDVQFEYSKKINLGSSEDALELRYKFTDNKNAIIVQIQYHFLLNKKYFVVTVTSPDGKIEKHKSELDALVFSIKSL